MNSTVSRQVEVAVSCERCTESSGSIKDGEFLGQVRDYPLLKNSAPWGTSS